MDNKVMKVWSGKCCLCDIGTPVNAKSTWGDPIELHTGDIIILWRGDYLGTDLEQWLPCSDLTVVVSDQYQTFSDGSISIRSKNPEPFPMGIKECGFDSPKWRIQVVKKYSDVVGGEHWPAWGFSFGYSESADTAMLKAREVRNEP